MGKPVYTLKKGEFFGENNIYGREKKIPVAFTAEETVVIQLTKDMVEDRFGEPIKYVILRNIINKAILDSEHLSTLSNVQREKIIDNMNNRIMQSSEVLFKKDDPMNNKLVLLLEGHLVNKEGKAYSLKTPSFVNEKAFFT